MFNGSMGGNSALAEQARTLLDFTQRLDINLLDQVVECMYTGKGDEQSSAEKILTTFKEHPDAWTKVDAILEFSTNQQTKYYALQILENLIKSRWNALPRNQCEGIKKYIVSLIIKTSSDAETMEREKVYLNKLNMILVQILKCEWPKKWPTFIGDIVGASKTNESLCQNNMIILKLLSEEVFDFSTGQMTQAKAKYLKDTMCSEFSQIFTLCQFVLDNSQSPQLLKCTLETLLRFLNWIPLGYIFETRLISTLIFKFFTVPIFRNIALKCLTEIAAINTEKYDDTFINMFAQVGNQLEQMLPQNTSIKEAYANGNDDEQVFVQNLALFLCTFLKEHEYKLENEQHSDVLIGSLNGLLLISEVEDIEIFKICLEYWNYLVSNLYYTYHNTYSGNQDRNHYAIKHRELYQTILTKLRYIMIARMAKPEEVLVVENDQGEVVREFMRDTDSIQLYKNMRETLVFLTNLDCADTERIMTEKLQNQVNNTEWSWKNVNTLCWAIGSISGAMSEDDERRFLVIVIKDLLGLCEQKRGKDNKAIIASNIMYVVGQYPRFLRAHWKFLKTVVNKLFEFMHETHEGVQDMACDTFIKIAQKCRRHFVTTQPGESRPFIEEILENINSIICDLQQQQVHTFYEAVGYMISSQSDEKQQEKLIQEYMSLPNQVWNDLMSQAMKNVEILKDPDAVRQLGNILKTNVHACKALGQPYVIQLGKIYLDMLNVYKVMSANITAAISINGESVTKQPLIRSMRTVKKETLNLISSWISRATEMDMVLKNFIPPLLDAVLLDYKTCAVRSAREAEVLSTITTVVSKLEYMITPKIPEIFDAVFECTLDMINKDFQEYPEHRTNFYLMLQQVVNYCFSALLQIPPEQFKLILDSIIWAFKHTMRNVADTGLQILITLLEQINNDKQAMHSFYQTYYTDIVQHLFDVITDSSHTSGLTYQASILAYMFLTIETGKINVPINPAVQTAKNQSNVQYVQEFVANLLKTAFSHLTDKQIQITVQGFFNLDQDIGAFKEHLRDFLVQIREYSGEDNSDLFLEEREASLRKAEEEKRKLINAVPGILTPYSQMSEDMQD